MSFDGYGSHAQPGSQRKDRAKPFRFGFFETLPGMNERGYPNRAAIRTLWVPKETKDSQIVVLDAIVGTMGRRFVSRIHNFKYNNVLGNEVVSLDGIDPRGDPFGVALRQEDTFAKKRNPNAPKKLVNKTGSRVWMLTGIQLSSYTIKSGANQGKVIEFPRVLIPVPLGDKPGSRISREDEFMNYARKLAGGLRGQVFDISRGIAETSPRIGENWFPSSRLTDDQMREKFANAAAAARYPIEMFIAPANYHEVLKPMAYADAYKAATYIAEERGFDLTKVVPPPKADEVKQTASQVNDAMENDAMEPAEIAAGEDESDLPF